jgi:chromosome segregation ATPase
MDWINKIDIQDLQRDVSQLKATCHEQDKVIATLTGRCEVHKQNIDELIKRIDHLAGLSKRLLERVEELESTGPIAECSSVNNVKVSTPANVRFDVVTKPENLNHLSEPEQQDKYIEMAAEVVNQVEEAHKRAADSKQQFGDINSKYDGPTGP